MPPFESELSVRHFDARCFIERGQLRPIEVVSARFRFIDHMVEVDGNRSRTIAKAFELRMLAVAARLAGKHGLREQSFAPERDQTFRVEVLRMNRPEAHAFSRAGTGGRARIGRSPSAWGRRTERAQGAG